MFLFFEVLCEFLYSHLSCDADWAKCAHSAPRHGEMDGGTAAGRPAGETGGTGCPESGESSPTGTRGTEEEEGLAIRINCSGTSTAVTSCFHNHHRTNKHVCSVDCS